MVSLDLNKKGPDILNTAIDEDALENDDSNEGIGVLIQTSLHDLFQINKIHIHD